MEKSILIFGYGSLTNEVSLHKTAPNSEILKIVILKNYKRSFTKPAKKHNVAGLNIEKSQGVDIYGVLIKLSYEDLIPMIEREYKYDLVNIDVLDKDLNSLINCYTFIYRKKDKREFILSESQVNYFNTCLEGVKLGGDILYNNFLETTYIGDFPIAKYDLDKVQKKILKLKN